MPIKIKNTVYPLPGENNSQGFTGREIIEIEEHFGLDGLTLISALSSMTPLVKGYTRAKALYSVAWICLTRAGEVVSLADVLNDVSINDIEPMDDEVELGKVPDNLSEVATVNE